MKRFLSSFLIVVALLVGSASSSYAIYDPTTVTNNKFGIHILFPDEIFEAAHLVNSSNGDWGYVTIPIQDSDRDLIKWQKFMDDCRSYHVIPIIRIATEGDYFVKGSWKIPDKYYIIDFANFLNSLDWPTKNRYVVIFNEPNRGDEWGGIPDPAAYANILNFAVDVFKERSDKFFVISAGLDNAAADTSISISQFNYMRRMNVSVPGIFGRIDGLAVHAYPNPGFSSAPSYMGTNGISSFIFEQEIVRNLIGKDLPVFITETGWSSETTPLSTQNKYYDFAFSNTWNDNNIIAVTPFILHSEQGPFRQFSFITENKKTDLYNHYLSMPKTKGEPQLEPKNLETVAKSVVLKTKFFTDELTKNINQKINKSTKLFFRWLLNF